MKAEHRHELKQNELAQWLSNFPNWAKENIRMITYFCVVIVFIAGWYVWSYYKKNVIQLGEKTRFSQMVTELNRSKMRTINGVENEGVDYSYTLIQTANKLRNFARNTKNDNMAAFAYIKQAEGLRAELYYRTEPVGQKYLKDQIGKAEKAYENAIERAKDNPSLLALANYGLGLCAEELGSFDKAKGIYQRVIDNEQFAGTTAVISAKHRLNVMDDYREKIVFQEVKQLPPPASMTTPGAANLKIEDFMSTQPAPGPNAVK